MGHNYHSANQSISCRIISQQQCGQSSQQQQCSHRNSRSVPITIINMIVKSFRHQLETLYSLAGYKVTGLSLPCSCRPTQPRNTHSQQLAFKVDIAHRLYREYAKDSFKFSEKGVTPRMIAEEIAIFAHESDDYRMEIDSFGDIFVTPTEQYLWKMKKELLQKDLATHVPVSARNAQLQANQPKETSFLFFLEDLSVSSLRIAFLLQLIWRKRLAVQECSAESMIKQIDLQRLNESEIEQFLQLNIVDLVASRVELKVRQKTITSKGIYETVNQFPSSKFQDCLSGCFRHKFVQFRRSNLQSLEEDQILKFGEVFPWISISQLKTIYPDSYRDELLKILRYTLKFQPKLPINLRESGSASTLSSSKLLELVRHRTPLEQLLLVMDALGADDILGCLQYFSSLKERTISQKQEKSALQTIERTINAIVDGRAGRKGESWGS